MRRVAGLGAAIAVLYIGVVAVTAMLTDRDVRPLFDAGAPAPPYRWVRPPPDFAPGNIRPRPAEVVFGVKPEDLPPAGASEDSQFVFNLPKGAIAPTASDTEVIARIEPVDPRSLGPTPPNAYTDGNAYRITFTYGSGAPAPVTAPGSVLLTVPVPAISVVYSGDGRTWQVVKSRHASATAVGAELPEAGYYLALTPEVIGSSGGDGGGAGRLVAPILITVLVAGALLAIPALVRRR